MLTNGFALFKGEGSASLAEDAARRVRRYAREVLASTNGEFAELDPARLQGEEVALAFSMEKGGLPLVHGYMNGDASSPEGEFSMLGRGADGFYGARGPLGTRGLWLVREGPNAGILFYQDRRATRDLPGDENRIGGSSFSKLNGVLYFPSETLYLDGNMNADLQCTRLLAKRLVFAGRVYISNKCDGGGKMIFEGTEVRLIA